MGDINAKAVEWGSPFTDARGAHINEWINGENLIVHNTRGTPTCVTPQGSSYIDVTISTGKLAKNITDWKITEEETLSYHAHIHFNVKIPGVPRGKPARLDKLVTNVDYPKFKIVLRELLNERETQVEGALCLEEVVRKALDTATTRRRDGNNKVPYWWNDAIELKRTECIRARRMLTRNRRRGDAEEMTVVQLNELLKNTRRELKREIARAKRAAWRDLLSRLDEDVWGEGYRIAVRHLRGKIPTHGISEETRAEAIRTLFPQRRDRWEEGDTVRDPPLFTQDELETAAGKLRTGTAPGMDGITPEAIKACVEVAPGAVLAEMNSLLRTQDFPSKWKTGRVVLIPKGDASDDGTISYRPITLLSVMGKLYEGMVRNRLTIELEEHAGIHQNQYGFRAGRSTMQAVERVVSFPRRTRATWNVMVTFDVKNAFNAVSWGVVVRKLEERGVSQYIRNIISRYLQDRTIQCGKTRRQASAGVPQGSVLGPTLWNVAYDDVLRLETDRWTEITAYADDLAVTVAANSREDLNRKLWTVVNAIADWMGDHHLSLAPHKTEAVVLKGPRKWEGIILEVMGQEIQISRQLKYLGMIIDSQGLFGKHVLYAVKKAERRVVALTKLMPNIGGPGSRKREVLMGVAMSTIMYGASIWHCALRINRHRKILESLQRKMLLRIGSAYRTVSTQALQVIVGVPPVDLLVRERVALWGIPKEEQTAARKRAREDTMSQWQERWSTLQGKAEWTKRLIPRVVVWVGCNFRRNNYWTTQFLSGHGSFGTYTLRIGKSETDNCIYCGDRDTPEHTVCTCPRWEAIRRREWGDLYGNINPQNIVGIMTASSRNWSLVEGGVKQVMEMKEKEEREFQQRNNRPPLGEH